MFYYYGTPNMDSKNSNSNRIYGRVMKCPIKLKTEPYPQIGIVYIIVKIKLALASCSL